VNGRPPAPCYPRAFPGGGVKVLIADDDRLIRTMLSDLLADLGHAVVEAADGVEAVALARRESPDLVILDFLMPKLSGLDALHALRDEGLRTPAVLLTAISGGSFRAMEGAEAVDVLLEKPITRRSLARALARATRA
jgi:two-component system, response regulator PdtaR